MGERGGWWWMDMSDDKISHSMNLSVQSKSGTSRWWSYAVSDFFLSYEICCGWLFTEASWDCLLTASTHWFGEKGLVAFFRICSASHFHVWLYVHLVVKHDIQKQNVWKVTFPWRTSQLELICTIWLHFDIWLFSPVPFFFL